MKARIVLSVAVAALGLTLAGAADQKFKVGDAGGMKVAQTFSFTSEAQFENFTGQTHKVTGAINFDPVKRTGSGKIEVDLGSVDTGIAMRNEHLQSDMWFNTAKFPKATFETTTVKHVKGDEYQVTGKLTLHGVTRTITTTATVRYLPESDATRKAMFMGNVVDLKCRFQVKLADYGIMIPDMAKGKVAETIAVNLNVFGYTG